jgi:hypothetical protein
MAKGSSEVAFSQVKKTLQGQCACYVLITCTQPSKEGKMEVQMNYEGDEDLAAFLVANASQLFDEKTSQVN